MLNLLTGTLLLSLLHALIPNHWAPVLAVARSEGWSARRAVGVTVVAGLAHVLSTLVVGVILGATLRPQGPSKCMPPAPRAVFGLGTPFRRN